MSISNIPASKETLSGLMENSSNIIRGMYACLLSDIQTLEQLETRGTKQICILCQQLSMVVNYSLMDIGVSIRATLGTNNAYEKRFHLKNLKASISESYKSILNFKKARKKSIWSKLGIEINGTNQVVEELYKKISEAPLVFKPQSLKVDRDTFVCEVNTDEFYE